jgi:hypothetical protein
VVAGGGAGGRANEPNYGGGGGAGGLQYINTTALSLGTFTVTVGDGGTENLNGQNSTLGSYVSIGGGCGGTRNGSVNGVSGGSGGGGRASREVVLRTFLKMEGSGEEVTEDFHLPHR